MHITRMVYTNRDLNQNIQICGMIIGNDILHVCFSVIDGFAYQMLVFKESGLSCFM